MRTVAVTQRAMAVSLAFMLVSCSATRYAEARPTGPRDLARSALVFEQQPGGQVAHAWIPLKEFDLKKFQHASSTMNVRRDIVRVSSSGLDEYCSGRHDQCVRDCLNSSTPFRIGHRKYMSTRAQPWRIARGWWCPENCMKAFVECKQGRGEWAEQYTAEFDAVAPAVDWIREHRTELVVVIAGVAFVVVVAGSGGAALALAPVLVMAEASPGMSSELHLAGVCR